MTAALWFTAFLLWTTVAAVVGLLVGGAIREAGDLLDDPDDDDCDDDCDDLACPDWDCDECTAELEQSIRRHPASQRSVKDPVTGRTWWA